MEINTYKSFSKLVHGGQLESETNYYFSRAFDTLEGFISEDEIKLFYVKNPFSQELSTQVMLFLENVLMLVNVSKEKTNILSIKLNKVEKVEMVVKESEFKEVILTIHLLNEEKITLNSLEDSNNHWNIRYAKKVKEIFKFLS